jgi:hypothetical protein
MQPPKSPSEKTEAPYPTMFDLPKTHCSALYGNNNGMKVMLDITPLLSV